MSDLVAPRWPKVAGESEVLREVLPTLSFTPRVPPLPTDESLETGAELRNVLLSKLGNARE